jgi:nucleoside-diphosphate-sugar epimerase
VRAVVRSEEKGEHFKSLFPKHAHLIEYVVVRDISAPGCYDEAAQGVYTIIHLASPLAGKGADNDMEKAYLIPATEGVKNILISASKSSSVRRVVLTSSAAAVVDSAVSFSKPYDPTLRN